MAGIGRPVNFPSAMTLLRRWSSLLWHMPAMADKKHRKKHHNVRLPNQPSWRASNVSNASASFVLLDPPTNKDNVAANSATPACPVFARSALEGKEDTKRTQRGHKEDT